MLNTAFYTHPFIKTIANTEKWTVCDKNKMPVDMYCLKYKQKVVGAAFHDNRSLTTLYDLTSTIPNVANCTYWLDITEDNFVVVDVEPSCPDAIKNKLLQLPYIYGEVSLSGKGFHLVLPAPDEFFKYPNIIVKPALKEEHGYYEILMNHYVTFTRNMICPAKNNADFISLFHYLLSQQKANAGKIEFDINEKTIDDIPYGEKLVDILCNTGANKSITDFYGDESRYEFSYACRLYRRLENIIDEYTKQQEEYNNMIQSASYKADTKTIHEYTLEEKAYIIYTVLIKNLPFRNKHDTTRQNLPWLLYLAQEVVGKCSAQDAAEKENNKNSDD